MSNQLIKEIGKLTVVELAQLVKELEEEFGVSAAAPVVAAAAPAAGAAPEVAQAEEKNEYKVTLKEAGAEKMKVIKALRTVSSFALKEAKDLVDGAPSVIAESAAKDDAAKMKQVLEEAGAKVELS